MANVREIRKFDLNIFTKAASEITCTVLILGQKNMHTNKLEAVSAIRKITCVFSSLSLPKTEKTKNRGM